MPRLSPRLFFRRRHLNFKAGDLLIGIEDVRKGRESHWEERVRRHAFSMFKQYIQRDPSKTSFAGTCAA
jgi:hypothetical protein